MIHKFFALVLADEIPPIYAGFSKCAEHIHCVLWCVYFFVEIAEALKQLELWYYVLLQQQAYLSEQEPFYFSFFFSTWTLIWPHVLMFCFW